jgi:hypothetical protein
MSVYKICKTYEESRLDTHTIAKGDDYHYIEVVEINHPSGKRWLGVGSTQLEAKEDALTKMGKEVIG